MQCVENCSDPDPRKRVLFEQPVWQTLQMFAGEMLCLLPVLYNYFQDRHSVHPVHLPDDANNSEDDGPLEGKAFQPIEMRGWSVLLLWLPAICDLTGTTLMNVGLLYTPVSIYQMTRGALVLWVGLFSVMFLRRKFWLYQWLSLVTVMIGVSIVGLSGSLAKEAVTDVEPISGLASSNISVREEIPAPATVFIGVLFILFAQIFAAAQFVVEEKIMAVYTIHPLLAVTYEGVFGFVSVLLCFPILIRYKSSSPFFDLSRGWDQIIGNPIVLWTSVAIAISIGLFNAFGLSVTRHVNATARSTADTCRTIGIWAVSLFLGWEHLLWPWTPLQLLGFALLVYGTFVFNDLTKPPKFLAIPDTPLVSAEVSTDADSDPDEQRTLLAADTL